jgi:hypothetical protein
MESFYLWPEQPAVSLLALWAISSVVLWAARGALRELIGRLSEGIGRASEALAARCQSAAASRGAGPIDRSTSLAPSCA